MVLAVYCTKCLFAESDYSVTRIEKHAPADVQKTDHDGGNVDDRNHGNA